MKILNRKKISEDKENVKQRENKNDFHIEKKLEDLEISSEQSKKFNLFLVKSKKIQNKKSKKDIKKTKNKTKKQRKTRAKKKKEFNQSEIEVIFKHYEEENNIEKALEEEIKKYEIQEGDIVYKREGFGYKRLGSRKIIFDEKIKESDGEVNERMDILFTSFNDEKDSFNTKFTEISQQIIREQVDSLLEELQENIETELKGLADEAVQEVAETISEMSGKITEAKDESATKREVIEPLFEQLEGVIDPVESAVEYVKDLADQWGVG